MIHGQLLYVFFFLSLQGPNSVFSLPLESKKPMKLEDVPLVRIKFRLSTQVLNEKLTRYDYHK